LPAPRNYFVCSVSYGSYLKSVNSVGKVAGYCPKHRRNPRICEF